MEERRPYKSHPDTIKAYKRARLRGLIKGFEPPPADQKAEAARKRRRGSYKRR